MALPTTSNTTRPRARGFHVRVDDLYLRLHVDPEHPLDIVTAPLAAPQVNTAQTAEEILNEYGRTFARVDFSGGEGLDLAHKRNLTDLDATRFWDSKHIDVVTAKPGQPSKLTLLPPTGNIESSADTNLHLAFDGTAVFMAEGSGGNTRRSADETAATPTFADSATGVGAEVLDLTTLGAVIYSAQGASGIRTCTANVWAAMAVVTHTRRVWGVKRQLLCASTSDGSVLAWVTLTGGAAGTHNTLVALAAGQEWRDAADCGPAVLACADDGAIYAFGFNSSGAAGGTLELKAQSVLGGSEIPYAIGYDGTFVHYCTREATPSGAIGRWYRATLSESFTLTGAELLKQWGDQSATIDHCPRRIIATRDAVFVGVYETGGSFLWRYDRATTGITRHLDLGASGLVVDMLVTGGRIFATVAGHGLRREQVGSFKGSGYLIGPLVDFFTASPKSWAGATLEHDALPDDTRVELYYTTDSTALTDPDSTAWVRAKNVLSGQDATETSLNGVEGRYLAGMLKIYSDDPDTDAGTAAPDVRGFGFRAYPGEGDVQITFHAVVSDVVERPGHRRQRVRGLGDQVYAELQGKEGGYAEVEVLRPSLVCRGVVEQIGTRIPAMATRGAAVDVCAFKFRGRRVSFAGVSQSMAAIGLEQIGESFIGGMEAA